MVLKHYTLIFILLLVFVWLLNTNIIIYIYNNCGLFSIFTSLIKKIVGAIAIFYKRGNISIAWRTPTKINYMVNIIDVLYTPNLFINLFSALKFKINKLYIITKNYII